MDIQNEGLLNNISIATPCQANWEEMRGDNQVRFCQSCELNVYNFSEMTVPAAEALIREKEGQLCVRYYQRHDGTMMTQDCPVGLAAKMHQKTVRIASLVATLVFGLLSSPLIFLDKANATEPVTKSDQATPVMGDIIVPKPTPLMGKPTAPPQPTVTPSPSESHAAPITTHPYPILMGKIAPPEPVQPYIDPK